MTRPLAFCAFALVVAGLLGCNPFAPPTRPVAPPPAAPTSPSPDSAPPTTAAGPVAPTPPTAPAENPLLAARRGHKPVSVNRGMERVAPDDPPKATFQLVKYSTAVGDLPAYLSPDPKDGKKHPAIIWITGGDCNSIGDVWTPAKADNDQTAAQYRQAGIVMMFPSLRGGNLNPGKREGYFGEVDDVLAAKKFLAAQPHVDPDRIYLGGHSTGGTLALLVAETGAEFRCVFSFGPVEDVSGYGPDYCPFNLKDDTAVKLRSPGQWLSGVRSRTLVMEGSDRGNIDSLMRMNKTNTTGAKNDQLLFYTVSRGTHFSILAPLNEHLAKQVAADTGPTCQITLPNKQPLGKVVPALLNPVRGGK